MDYGTGDRPAVTDSAPRSPRSHPLARSFVQRVDRTDRLTPRRPPHAGPGRSGARPPGRVIAVETLPAPDESKRTGSVWASAGESVHASQRWGICNLEAAPARGSVFLEKSHESLISASRLRHGVNRSTGKCRDRRVCDSVALGAQGSVRLKGCGNREELARSSARAGGSDQQFLAIERYMNVMIGRTGLHLAASSAICGQLALCGASTAVLSRPSEVTGG